MLPGCGGRRGQYVKSRSTGRPELKKAGEML